MRIIGLDIHRAFAEAVAWDEGELKLSNDDVVVVEATGNGRDTRAQDPIGAHSG